jgi:hypothetical protein
MLKPQLFRDMDFARMKLLKSKAAEDKLSADEENAVVAHLLNNVPQIRSVYGNDRAAVVRLVREGTVMNAKRKSEENAPRPLAEDILYKRHKISSTCTLVLTGKVGILAGKEEFASSVTSWSILAADALVLPEGTYSPEFTAFIASDTVRLIQMSIFQIQPAQMQPRGPLARRASARTIDFRSRDDRSADVQDNHKGALGFWNGSLPTVKTDSRPSSRHGSRPTSRNPSFSSAVLAASILETKAKAQHQMEVVNMLHVQQLSAASHASSAGGEGDDEKGLSLKVPLLDKNDRDTD